MGDGRGLYSLAHQQLDAEAQGGSADAPPPVAPTAAVR